MRRIRCSVTVTASSRSRNRPLILAKWTNMVGHQHVQLGKCKHTYCKAAKLLLDAKVLAFFGSANYCYKASGRVPGPISKKLAQLMT